MSLNHAVCATPALRSFDVVAVAVHCWILNQSIPDVQWGATRTPYSNKLDCAQIEGAVYVVPLVVRIYYFIFF